MRDSRGFLLVLVCAIVFAVALESGRSGPVACETDLVPDANTVVMLGASWCGYCARARRLFEQKDIAYCEYDIERSSAGASMYAQSGARLIPIIYVRDNMIRGFNADEIMQTLVAEGIASFED